MPQRPPIHRPVGRRDKRERDRDTDRKRDPAIRALYRSARWQHARRLFLAAHPLCAECQRQDRLTAASVVDHITPHRGDTARFWDQTGWQPLCAPCHSRKTAAEDGGFGNRRREPRPRGEVKSLGGSTSGPRAKLSASVAKMARGGVQA